MPADQVNIFDPAGLSVVLNPAVTPRLGSKPEQWYLANILAVLLHGQVAGGGSIGTVTGTIADGAAAGATKPIIISGVDAAGNVQRVLTEVTGEINVAGQFLDGDTFNAGTQKFHLTGARTALGFVFPLRCDNTAAVFTTLDGTIISGSGALEASRVQFTGNGSIHSASAYNNSAEDRYLMLFNAVALPADGTFPYYGPFLVKPKETFTLPNRTPIKFTTGFVLANSTTAPSLTVGAADFIFKVHSANA